MKGNMFGVVGAVALLSLASLASLARGEPRVDPQALLGIDLGYSYITSAYFTETGPVVASRFEAPEAYKSMITTTLNAPDNNICSDGSDANDLSNVLESVLRRALAEARQQKDDSINIGALIIPNHISQRQNEKCYLQIFSALKRVAPHLANVPCIKPSRLVTLTFSPNDCYDYREKSRAGSTEEEFLVMLLDMTSVALRTSLIEIITPGPIFSVMEEFSIPTTSSWSNVPRHELRPAIESMLTGYKPDTIKSVIFSADHALTDVEKTAVTSVIDTLDDAVPGLARKVHDFGDGIEYRNAIGAACVAKQFVLYPYDPDRDVQYASPNPHNEL